MILINSRSRAILTVTLTIAFMMACSQTSAADKFIPLELNQVKIGGEIGRRIDNTINNNLLKLDFDGDFLSPFDQKLVNGFNKYIGVGRAIDACVRFAAYSNDPRVIAVKQHLVKKMIERQLPDGYIGMFAPDKQMTGLWSITEMIGLSNGLISNYRYFRHEPSLKAARRMLDYIIENWETMPPDWSIKALNIPLYHATFGLEEALIAFYNQTGEEKYLDFCTKTLHLPDWDMPIQFSRPGSPHGHAGVYLGRSCWQLELYILNPDPKLTRLAKRIINFITKHDGMVITGTVGKTEQWDNTQDGRGNLGETCASTQLIRLYDKLLQIEGNALYGDLAERTIYNALFAAQNPRGREIRYYTPLEGPRPAYGRDTYCCPSQFRKVMSEIPCFIYYRTDKGLAVNLYTNSTAEFQLDKGPSIKVKQKTDYPTSGKVTIYIEPAEKTKFNVLLRIPKWCEQAEIYVNGKAVKGKIKSGSFFKIQRNWHPGDKIQLDMPMKWRFIRGRKRQAGRVAVMRGPVVFCLNPPSHRSLDGKDAADLTDIAIVPDSLSDPILNDTVRPGGLACKINAWGPGHRIKWDPKLQLVLTEFPDPNGKVTYFRAVSPASPEQDYTVDDELLGTGPSGGTQFYFPRQ